MTPTVALTPTTASHQLAKETGGTATAHSELTGHVPRQAKKSSKLLTSLQTRGQNTWRFWCRKRKWSCQSRAILYGRTTGIVVVVVVVVFSQHLVLLAWAIS